MKHLKFLQIVLALTLCACTSCEEDDKLPGTKPEMLIGKWETSYELWWSYTVRNVVETIEFTKSGGSITQVTTYTYLVDYKPVDTFVDPFTDWSYDGQNIYFIYKKDGYTDPWKKPISDLTSESFKLGSYTYYRKSDN